MSISVDIKNLTFKYGEETVLDEISLYIKPRSFISIIGPNGSGKSTLLKNISSVLKPYSGLVKLGSQDITKMKPKEIAKKMAVVPQESSVEFRFTAMDIVMMGRSPHLGRFESESREDFKIAKKAMELTDTWRLRDRIISELSGGERQRVIIARALTQEPKIILLDEPTAYLDIQHQIEILELLEKLNMENGVTVIAVLHEINLAARFSDYLLLLKGGKIIAGGRPEEVVTHQWIKEAYTIDIAINRNPFSGSPHIIPLSNFKENRKTKKIKVHVVCGGGTGYTAMQMLSESGFDVSAGVINVGDSDWEATKLFDVEVVEEAPFVEISEKVHLKNLHVIDNADILILTSIPLGYGNLKNLEAVKYGLDKGKQVYFLKEYDDKKNFDYTKGLGLKALDEIEKKGAEVYKTINQLISHMNALPNIKKI